MDAGRQEGLLVIADRPIVPFLYQLLRSGDLAPDRLEEVLDDLERVPPFLPQRYELIDLAHYAASAADRLERLGDPVISVQALEGPSLVELKGFVLVLVVDEPTKEPERDPLSRVCREFDVLGADALARELMVAAEQASRQMRIEVRRRAGLGPAALES